MPRPKPTARAWPGTPFVVILAGHPGGYRERAAATRNFAVYEIPGMLEAILAGAGGFRPPVPLAGTRS